MLLGGVLGMIASALSGVGTIVDTPASALAVLIISGGTTFLAWKLSLRLLPPNFLAYVWDAVSLEPLLALPSQRLRSQHCCGY